MRFTSARSQATAAVGKEQLRKDRAAARLLREAYPAVASVRVDLAFVEPDVVAPADQSHTLHPPARAFFEFPCPHANCDGTLDLTATVERLVSSSSPRSTGTLDCPGSRSKGGTNTRSACGLQAQYSITTRYHAVSEAD